MRFHHKQKVVVTNGFFKTYKGFILDFRIEKDSKTSYLVDISKGDVSRKEWLQEDILKKSLF